MSSVRLTFIVEKRIPDPDMRKASEWVFNFVGDDLARLAAMMTLQGHVKEDLACMVSNCKLQSAKFEKVAGPSDQMKWDEKMQVESKELINLDEYPIHQQLPILVNKAKKDAVIDHYNI